jgi:putative transposase
MKPGVYTQMYAQIVFAVNKRENLLSKNHRQKIFEYIGGIIKDLGHKTIIVNGVSDHIHILPGLNPNIPISVTVHDIKRGSSLFINQNRLVNGRFSWQEGYGCFTCSRFQIDNIFTYI